MIEPFLPKEPVKKSSPYPAYTQTEPVPKKSISARSKDLASSLDSQIAELGFGGIFMG